ncbi:MAG: hypothetical protein WB445_09475, partial [Acinetobacter sp.]
MCHFDFWRCASFDRSSRFNDWRFDWSGFQGGGSGAFGLLVGLCFGRGADHGAGNGCGNSQAGGQVSGAWCFIAFAGFGFFRTFDHIAVGIALTLATVAATTLATGTAAWAIAFGAVLTFFLQLLFVGGQLFFSDGSGLLGTGLTFFTRWAWSAFFAWRAGRALFSGRRRSRSSSRSCIQRLTQFTNALFAFATWLAVFTRCARGTFFSWSTRCAFFTCYGWCLFTGFAWLTLFAWLTWCALFTRCTFFARLAFFIAATVTVAALLATVATLLFIAASRTLGGSRFLDHGRGSRLFLGGEQADQRFHQALEQA